MKRETKTLLVLLLLLLLQSHLIYSQTIVNTLPGFSGQLPFMLETGYIGIGEKEEVQFFYYFVESETSPEQDPIILYLTGGPGASVLHPLFHQFGPLSFKFGEAFEDTTLILNPNSWTKMTSIIFFDLPAGTGFSYATTKEASICSDSLLAKQANEFLRKFLIDHPKFLKNPLYIAGISYTGLITPIVTLEIYNGNERGDEPLLNIQGYNLCSPLTDKYMDVNSRFEYAHRVALISDDIYKPGVENCRGNYVNTNTANSLCLNSLERFNECTNGINNDHILEPSCDPKQDPEPYCRSYDNAYIVEWANRKSVQKALNIREGTIEKWEMRNTSVHYEQGKNDTFCYSYDISSSFAYHKKLVGKNCRALIFSGDHDMNFPHVGIEKWITSLNLGVHIPWEPFYVDNQIGGYKMTYAKNNFSLTYATVKGAGHQVSVYKPKEAMLLLKNWIATNTYSSDA